MRHRDVGLIVYFVKRADLFALASRLVPSFRRDDYTQSGATRLGLVLTPPNNYRNINLYFSDRGGFALIRIGACELTSRQLASSHTEEFQEKLWNPYLDLDQLDDIDL